MEQSGRVPRPPQEPPPRRGADGRSRTRSQSPAAGSQRVRIRVAVPLSARTRGVTASVPDTARSCSLADVVDEELARLQVERDAARERVHSLASRLETARQHELQELQALRLERAKIEQLRTNALIKLQARVRGYFVRKNVVVNLNASADERRFFAALRPALKTQLEELRHKVHGLQHSEEDRAAAATRLQAWWRAIAARRVLMVIRISERMQALFKQMARAATRIQATFRMFSTYHMFHKRIEAGRERRRLEQAAQRAALIDAVILLQQAFRQRLARARVAKARLSKCEVAEPFAEAEEAGNCKFQANAELERLAKKDREIEKLESAGLVPFYLSSSRELVRHKIGGPSALRMQVRLSTTLNHASDEESSGEDLTVDKEHSDDVWDVYPGGLSAGLLRRLTPDAWPGGRRPRGLSPCRRASQRSRARRNSAKPRPARMVVPLPPCNTQMRAHVRDEAKSAAEKQAGATGEIALEAHALFTNVPILPPLKSKRNITKCIKVRCVNDDGCSWGSATSFY